MNRLQYAVALGNLGLHGNYLSLDAANRAFSRDEMANLSSCPDELKFFFSEAQPFVYCGNNFKPVVAISRDGLINDASSPSAKFDAPFRTFTFELSDSSDLFKYDYDDKHYEGVDIKVKQTLALFTEVSPRVFKGYLMTVKSSAGVTVSIGFVEMTKLQLDGLLSQVVELINSSTLGVAESSERIKYKISGKKVRRSVGRVVYVKPRQQSVCFFPAGVSIDYSHRFLVRGHWRRLKSDNQLGKDRAGEYCIFGYTWVVEFEKGGKDKDLKKKVRLVA